MNKLERKALMKFRNVFLASIVSVFSFTMLPILSAGASVNIHGSPTNYAYPPLVKNASSLKGQRITHSACIFQFDGITGTKSFLAEWTNGGGGYWSDFVNVKLPNAKVGSNAYQGDVVRMTGYILGNLTYTTKNGGSNTVPNVMVTALSVIGHGCN